MLEHVVSNKAELVAAVRAAAQTTFQAAHANPVRITLGSAVYRFPHGIHETRAEQIVRNIMRTSAKAFNVKESLV